VSDNYDSDDAATAAAGPLPLPLDVWHRARGARMVEFAGYSMPVQYEGIIAEHLWTRSSAGLFDVSHMGQLTVSGEAAAESLEALLPGDISALKPGRMRYSLLLAEDGGILDDLVIYRLDEDRLHVHDFVAATRAAERALLGYMANHDSQVKFALLRTGREYPLWHLVDDTYPVESKLHAGWQLRLVDLQAAFEGRPWPADVRGSLTMQVADEHAPWNAGTWRVTFEGGAAVVRRAPGAVAGLSATVQTWAQLYAGFVRPEVALANDRLAVADRSGMELLGQALRGPGMDFTDPF
jgi:hypothetical protein